MGNLTVQQLLEGWVNWLFQQPYPDNGADDPDGTVAQTKNGKASPYWFLAGTWGNKGTNPNPVARTVKVPEGKSLFIVVGSSHATEEEVKTASNPNPSDQDLIDHAKLVHSLWKNCDAFIDGSTTSDPAIQRGIEPSHVLMPYILDKTYYSQIAKMQGPVRIATIADVLVFDSNRLGRKAKTHSIALKGESKAGTPSSPTQNEPDYKLDVTYTINVDDPVR